MPAASFGMLTTSTRKSAASYVSSADPVRNVRSSFAPLQLAVFVAAVIDLGSSALTVTPFGVA